MIITILLLLFVGALIIVDAFIMKSTGVCPHCYMSTKDLRHHKRDDFLYCPRCGERSKAIKWSRAIY